MSRRPALLRSALSCAAVAAAVLTWSPQAEAKITKIVIDSPADWPNSRTLLTGQAIQYETITGRAFGETGRPGEYQRADVA